MNRPTKLHHSALRIRDLERSRKFYEGVLGFRPIERPDFGFPGAWYGIGESQVHLIGAPKHAEGIDPTDPHFAVEVEDYQALKKTLGEAGVEFLEFGRILWVRDPDGYTVELREPGAL